MIHASLFTGIGGFDLAAEWIGWTNLFQCEKDEWCLKLLNQNFPTTAKHGDIKTTDFIIYRGRVDILSGGFPCQPYSTAGKRLGKDDERHLWPEMLRAIREIQPPWIVGENVRGLTNWNGGLVFDEVQADLEAAGYEVTPFLLPAAGVNAPHRRDRIWFIAYSAGNGHERRQFRKDRSEEATSESERNQRERIRADVGGTGTERAATYSSGIRCNGGIYQREGVQWREQACGEVGAGYNEAITDTHSNECAPGTEQYKQPRETTSTDGSGVTSHSDCRVRSERGLQTVGSDTAVGHLGAPHARSGGNWEDFPTQPGVCGGDARISHRVDRLKGLGNAVVPQVVLQIFKAIQAYEDLKQ